MHTGFVILKSKYTGFARLLVFMTVTVVIVGTVLSCGGKNKEVITASTVLAKTGVSRGVCVLLGDTKCELALEMARESEFLIYVQLLRAG